MKTDIRKIIVVDDSKTSQMITKSCLEICGLTDTEYLFAADGIEALNRIQKEAIDLAVVDLNMPKMNGTELLKHIKSDIKTVYIPVIILSSIINPKKENDLKALGAAFILKKPITPATFEPIIHQL